MKSAYFSILFGCITVLSLNACTHIPTAQTHPSTHNLIVKSDAHDSAWHYEHNGAAIWGDIPGNEECKSGIEQSPINIIEVEASENSAPKPNFGKSDIEVTNNGHTIVYTPTDTTNTTLFGNESYTLKQFHYHIPSEHQISGINYAGEIHFVHANDEGNLAVIGVMLTPTSHQTVLAALTNSARKATESTHSVVIKQLDLNNLLPDATVFYNYNGSLTTPPCSEQVKWFVAERPIAISAQDLHSLTQLYDGNNRPIQPQGTRVVKQVK